MSGFHGIPLLVLTDSYKPTHAFMLPEAKKVLKHIFCWNTYNKERAIQKENFFF